jgi:hypothetical protein
MWNKSSVSWGGSNVVTTEEDIIQEHESSIHLNVYLAVDGDEVVGYCSFSEYKEDEGALYIALLNVRPDYHGKKVGVATLALTGMYRRCADLKNLSFHEDNPDWTKIYNAYGPKFTDYIKNMNSVSATAEINSPKLAAAWPEICAIIKEELPEYNELLNIMNRAGAAVSFSEIDIDRDLAMSGILYHPFMRHKVTLTRLFYMMNVNVADLIEI